MDSRCLAQPIEVIGPRKALLAQVQETVSAHFSLVSRPVR